MSSHELHERLRKALRPETPTPRSVTAEEMAAVRKEAEQQGIDFNKMLVSVCQELSAERKK